MTWFRYTFGYETPQQAQLNARNGWDDEDSATLLIEAPSEVEAVAWGRQVAEAFVARLYAPALESWSAGGFADDIEHVAAVSTPTEVVAVKCGQWPDWGRFPNGGT